MDQGFNYEERVIELYDLALLMNYERAAYEPRFRHAKLREVATSTRDFKTIRLLTPEWTDCEVPKRGFVFEQRPSTKANEDEPDLPTNMLPSPVPIDLRNLTPKELESYYWQARNHDGCYKSIALFQNVIDLFPSYTRLRVRTVQNKDATKTYTMLVSEVLILELNLIEPTSMNMACVLRTDKTYITGSDVVSKHAVLGLSSPGAPVDSILDLASMQFGDVGRGFKGRGLFVLESLPQYTARLDKFARSNTIRDYDVSNRMRDAPDDAWWKVVAAKVKERWDKRKTEFWCGHCGAPRRGEELKMCSVCKTARYCNAEHQSAAWAFHKHFCSPPRPKKSTNDQSSSDADPKSQDSTSPETGNASASTTSQG